MGRYTGSPDTLVFDQRIDLRGFSAGSFAGLSTLHLLWKIPNVVTNGKLGAIACPPQLIVTPPTDHTLHLLHYEADQLCVWKPGGHQLDQLQIRYTYVSTEGPAYKEHFGSKEHNYSHWLSLNHTAGWWDLARFLFMNPEAASSAKRDATPLRLLSWLTFRLEPAVEKLIEATMLYLSTVNEVKDSELLELGRMHLEVDTPFASAEVLRDHLIELISVRNCFIIIGAGPRGLVVMCKHVSVCFEKYSLFNKSIVFFQIKNHHVKAIGSNFVTLKKHIFLNFLAFLAKHVKKMLKPNVTTTPEMSFFEN